MQFEMRTKCFSFFFFFFSASLLGALAQQCGWQAGGALCPGGLCCSSSGYCGTTDPWCGEGCQSQCGGGTTPTPPPPPTPPTPPTPPGPVSSLLSRQQFEDLLKHRNDAACPARGFYTYDAFTAAANYFSEFAASGDKETRIREIAAFLAQTSHETTGGWPTAPDGPYAWGYCFLEEVNPTSDYCDPSQYKCAQGKRYYGRGPIQLSWNYNYAQAGEALGLDLLNNPDLVSQDPVISFKTAIWFWMTQQPPKPSCHDVITGKWTPSQADLNANRLPGYGVITNIINGGIECGSGVNSFVQNRIGFYEAFCQKLGVDTGDNLDCYRQTPFGSSSSALWSILK